MDKYYYVYEWYNVDTGYIFYVGKGKKNRAMQVGKSRRNDYFMRYYNKYVCDYRIIKTDMSEVEALAYENITIVKYKLGNECSCNYDDGGKQGGSAFGELNGMYGKTHTDEVKEHLRILNSDGRHKGENNTQYGKSFHDRMDAKTYSGWINAHKQMTGENNPNFGNRTMSKRYSEDKDYALEKQSRKGIRNGRCIPISMFDLNGTLVQNFPYVFACAEYLVNNGFTRIGTKLSSTYSNILKSVKENMPYLKHTFKYLAIRNMTIPC